MKIISLYLCVVYIYQTYVSIMDVSQESRCGYQEGRKFNFTQEAADTDTRYGRRHEHAGFLASRRISFLWQ